MAAFSVKRGVNQARTRITALKSLDAEYGYFTSLVTKIEEEIGKPTEEVNPVLLQLHLPMLSAALEFHKTLTKINRG